MIRLTEDELEAIKARVEAATPGPWVSCSCDEVQGHDDGCENANRNPVAQLGWKHTAAGVYTRADVDPYRLANEGDVDFIAHARQDIPALLTYVEQLRRNASGQP